MPSAIFDRFVSFNRTVGFVAGLLGLCRTPFCLIFPSLFNKVSVMISARDDNNRLRQGKADVFHFSIKCEIVKIP